MYSKISVGIVIVASICFSDAAQTQVVSANIQGKTIFTLPEHIAQELRDLNTQGHRGSCPESNIFIHAFHYISNPDRRGTYDLIWFLGAPDYLCKTNSFISVIVDSSGNWKAGKAQEESWRGSRNLAGVPVLFQHVGQLGFFLTSEWQVEGPENYMYFSIDGETWTSLVLPTPTRKSLDINCCDAPTIGSMCIADSGSAYISYEESTVFEARIWRATVDDSFPHNIDWAQVSELPEDVSCAGLWPQEFIPHSLREKTGNGALFDVWHNRSVLIPGPTK